MRAQSARSSCNSSCNSSKVGYRLHGRSQSSSPALQPYRRAPLREGTTTGWLHSETERQWVNRWISTTYLTLAGEASAQGRRMRGSDSKRKIKQARIGPQSQTGARRLPAPNTPRLATRSIAKARDDPSGHVGQGQGRRPIMVDRQTSIYGTFSPSCGRHGEIQLPLQRSRDPHLQDAGGLTKLW